MSDAHDRNPLLLALGALAFVGGAGGLGLGTYLVLTSAYRRARLEQLLHDPSRMSSIDPVTWGIFGVLVAALVGGIGLMTAALARR